ncbi:hypothetical protein ACLOJK_022115 [Asimina triloba]
MKVEELMGSLMTHKITAHRWSTIVFPTHSRRTHPSSLFSVARGGRRRVVRTAWRMVASGKAWLSNSEGERRRRTHLLGQRPTTWQSAALFPIPDEIQRRAAQRGDNIIDGEIVVFPGGSGRIVLLHNHNVIDNDDGRQATTVVKPIPRQQSMTSTTTSISPNQWPGSKDGNVDLPN